MSGQGSITLKDAYEIFYPDNKSRRLPPATVAFYGATLLLVFRWLKTEQVTLLSEVIAHHIRKFLTLRQDAGLSTYTQHKYARALRTFFRFCVREGLIGQSPMATVTMPRVEKLIPTSFTGSEVKSILDECTTERDKTIVYVLLDTGVRAAELLALNVGDVDIKQGQITVLYGKGQKQRIVYFGARTRRQKTQHRRIHPDRHNQHSISVKGYTQCLPPTVTSKAHCLTRCSMTQRTTAF